MKQIILLQEYLDGIPVINGVAIRRVEIEQHFINAIPNPSKLKSHFGADDIAKMLAHAIANKGAPIFPIGKITKAFEETNIETFQETFLYSGESGEIRFTLSISSTAKIIGIKFNLKVVGVIK